MLVDREPQRIGIIGFGAIGRRMLGGLQADQAERAKFAVLVRDRSSELKLDKDAEAFTSLDDFIRWKPSKVIECASHEAVAACVPTILENGIPVVLASIGALADQDLRHAVELAALKGGASYTFVSGAVAGLDALRSARIGGLDMVRYTGRKAPSAWAGSPADKLIDLSSVTEPTVIFKGSAAEVCGLYPKNANVAAAIALSGVGFDRTQVELIADPSISVNMHAIEATGAFGRLTVHLENASLPENPKTSMLAALSVEEALLCGKCC